MKNSRQRNVVLTGATGFLGSHLMSAFIEDGSNLTVLGRSRNGTGLKDRVLGHLTWFGMNNPDSFPDIIEADLLKPRLGIEEQVYETLCRSRPVIVHCASDTSFSDNNLPVSIDANIGTVRGIVELARDCDSPFLHYISTAYVASPSQPVSYEIEITRSDFANIYEETKTAAEKLIITECPRQGIPYTIVRPSIVYGHSGTGRANYFKALYYHVRSLKIIRDIYRKDIQENSGLRSRDLGIFAARDGCLYLPMRIFLTGKGNLNLIPIDFFIRIMKAIVDDPLQGCIYHVTNDVPKSIEELAEYCERFLQIKGLQIIYDEFPDDGALSPPEEIFNRLARPYLPYLCDTRTFDRTNTRTSAPGIDAPEMTYEIFKRCMEYAVNASWGNNGSLNNSIDGIR
ncbi:MAG: SDR family oxidoreductase [Syntrophorhabdaceae bacterium]